MISILVNLPIILSPQFADLKIKPEVTLEKKGFFIRGGKNCASEFVQVEKIIGGNSDDPDDKKRTKKTFNRYCNNISEDKVNSIKGRISVLKLKGTRKRLSRPLCPSGFQ